jgi:hypothetical protein
MARHTCLTHRGSPICPACRENRERQAEMRMDRVDTYLTMLDDPDQQEWRARR